MGHNLVSLVVDPTPARIARTERFDSTSQNDLELGPECGGRRDIGRFQGESGTISGSFDPNIVPDAGSRRTWVSVCSVLCFCNQNIRRSTSDPRRFSRLCGRTQLESTSLYVFNYTSSA